jgi:hypothetical protein
MPVTSLPQVAPPSGIKSIQRGVVSLNNSTSATAVISAVNVAKSEIRYLGCGNNGTAQTARVELTNSTTVSAITAIATSNSFGFEVTEWY